MQGLPPEETSAEVFSPQDPLLDPDPEGGAHPDPLSPTVRDSGSLLHAITCPGRLLHSNGRFTSAVLVLFGCTVAVAALFATVDTAPFDLGRAFFAKWSGGAEEGTVGHEYSGPDLSDSIVGSRLTAGAQAEHFRTHWECVTSLNTHHWAYEPEPRVLSWPKENFTSCGTKKGYLGLASNEAVVKGKYTSANWTVAESLKYVWRPRREGLCRFKEPDFATLDAAGFCKALRKSGGSLFVVGDSLSAQFFLSLRYQLQTFGESVSPLPNSPICVAFLKQLRGKHKRSLPSWPGCEGFMFCGKSREEGGVEAYFSASLFLKQIHEGVDVNSGAGPPTENAFGDEMVASNASVVLLNRGAHFAPTEEFAPELNHTLRELREMLPKTLIIYRSTPHGHPNCSQYEKPLESPMNTSDMPFNWGKFEEQNKFAKIMVESIGGVFMDVSPMMSVRPDWHIVHRRSGISSRPDCLHHCLPGPQGDWAKLLGGMLCDLI